MSRFLDFYYKLSDDKNKKEIALDIPESFKQLVDDMFSKMEGDVDQKEAIKKSIFANYYEYTSTSLLKERLAILYDYEKNYLSLVQQFKEEIKFIGSMQEDLRKERAKFFANTLGEVSSALNEAKVQQDVANQWIKELVSSYTKSLDVSACLIEESTVEAIAEVRGAAKLIKENNK